MRERPGLPGLPPEDNLSPNQRAGETTLESLNQAQKRMAEEKEWANKIAQAKENAGDETVLEDEDIEIIEDKDLPN